MPKFTHIIWDWNGTLFDDAWLCRDVVNSMLISRNKPPLSEERYQEVFDFPVKDYYQRAGFDFSVDPYEILANKFISEYERRRGECRLRAGAKDVLEGIAEAGLGQSILSVYSQKTLDDVVASFGIPEYFIGIYGLDNHYAEGKIDIGRRMIAQASFKAERAVLIGDTTHDYEVACAIGASCILMPGGHHAKQRLLQCGVAVMDSLQEILNYLLS